MSDLVDFAQPLQGTASQFDFSNGNTLPLCATPWGMTHWFAQTRHEPLAGWPFHPDDTRLQGIRATHQPSPWIGDYASFTVMPVVGQVGLGPRERSSSIAPGSRVLRPDYMVMRLQRYGCTVEVAPSCRCALMRLRYDASVTAGLLVQPFHGPGTVRVDTERGVIEGWTRGDGGHRSDSPGVGPADFNGHFVIEIGRPITGGGVISDGAENTGIWEQDGGNPGVAVRFAARAGEEVLVRIATSFISAAQARVNLQRELGDRSFEAVRAAARDQWNDLLGRIAIEGATDAQAQTFYSGLYRALLFPRVLHEPDAEGRLQHRSPYIGEVRPGVMVTDNGFWDTFRTVYPLLSIAYPDMLGQILQGWVNAAEQGGWMPKWASPGYRACMIGTHTDVIFADAMVKGIAGFDHASAYERIRRNAFEVSPEPEKYGRVGMAQYLELGYVPCDEVAKATSRTQDFAYNDWAVAQCARLLGRVQDAAVLEKRAQNYRHVFDATSGFFRGRRRDGSWDEPFDPIAWGGAFVEGSAWQFRFNVPHDVEGLAALHGGRERLVERLEEMLARPADFRLGTYRIEVHEMSEMAAAPYGQYAHSNQPVHHVLFLFAAAGRPDMTRHWVRRMLSEYYKPTPDGLPGDEDNGEMGAWYVLGAMGLLPLCPGRPEYVLGSPLFPCVRVRVPGRRELVLRTAGDVARTPQVRAITHDGTPVPGPAIAHEAIAAGGEVLFELVHGRGGAV